MSEDLFATLDADGTGLVDEAEFSSALGKVGVAESDAAALVKQLDGDGNGNGNGNSDGSVSKEELSAGIQKLADQFEAQFNASRTTQAHGGLPPPASPEDAFAAIDSDGGGSIDKAELQAAYGQGEDSALADEVFGALDSDGDDLISKDELAQGMRAAGEGAAADAPPPARGGGMPPGGAGEKQYEPADANEDGTVTIQESMAYEAEQASRKAESTSDGQDAALDKLLAQLAKTYADASGPAAGGAVAVTA
jgi:Ca2+-binding EF-hand superfamily protein